MCEPESHFSRLYGMVVVWYHTVPYSCFVLYVLCMIFFSLCKREPYSACDDTRIHCTKVKVCHSQRQVWSLPIIFIIFCNRHTSRERPFLTCRERVSPRRRRRASSRAKTSDHHTKPHQWYGTTIQYWYPTIPREAIAFHSDLGSSAAALLYNSLQSTKRGDNRCVRRNRDIYLPSE
jgi:hypothetical protein